MSEDTENLKLLGELAERTSKNEQAVAAIASNVDRLATNVDKLTSVTMDLHTAVQTNKAKEGRVSASFLLTIMGTGGGCVLTLASIYILPLRLELQSAVNLQEAKVIAMRNDVDELKHNGAAPIRDRLILAEERLRVAQDDIKELRQRK